MEVFEKPFRSHFERPPSRSVSAGSGARRTLFRRRRGPVPRLSPKTASRTRRWALLLELARQSALRERIDAMFRGDKINITENRAVLHVALRAPKGEKILVDGVDVVPEVHAVLDKMAAFSRPRALRRMEGIHRQAHPQRHQHRDRRFRSRPGDGLRSAEALQRRAISISALSPMSMAPISPKPRRI